MNPRGASVNQERIKKTKATPPKMKMAEEQFDPYNTGRTRNHKALEYNSAKVKHRR